MPPQRGSQFTQSTGAQAFIDNLLMGANIRQGEKERDVANQIDQQTITQNDQVIAAEAARVVQEQELAKQTRFNQEEELRNAAALGTVQSTPGKANISPDVNLSSLPTGVGAIEEDVIRARDYRGDVEISQGEVIARQQADERKLDRVADESVAKSGGQLAVTEAQQINTLARIEVERVIKDTQTAAGHARALEIGSIQHEQKKAELRIQASARRSSQVPVGEAQSLGTTAAKVRSGTEDFKSFTPTMRAQLSHLIGQETGPNYRGTVVPYAAPDFKIKNAVNDNAVYGTDLLNLMDEALEISAQSGIDPALSSVVWRTEANRIKRQMDAALAGMARIKGESGGRLSDMDIERSKGAIVNFLKNTHEQNVAIVQDFKEAIGRGVVLKYPNLPLQQIQEMHPELAPYVDSFVQGTLEKDIGDMEQAEQVANTPQPDEQRAATIQRTLANESLMRILEQKGISPEQYADMVSKRAKEGDPKDKVDRHRGGAF